MKQVLYNLYVYLIVFPVAILLTIICAITTLFCVFWPKSEFIHKVQEIWSRSFFRLLFIPVEIEGLEHIEPGKSYVFVSNHQSMFDVWLIFGWLPVIFKWMMKKEIRRIPLVGTALVAGGHIFVDRTNPRAALKSMEAIKAQLKDGACTVIFPEGTRTKTGKMGPFKRGAFQIALDLGLPVVPISLSGCMKVMRSGSWAIHRHPVKLYVGEPILLGNPSREEQAEVIQKVHDAVESHIEF